jgi:site-specific recombinase XerC
VQPFHVAAFVKDLQRDFAAPTVKQHLAGLRMLFDCLVTGQVLDTNPAHAVRGPKHVVKKGKTPVLNGDEARAMLDAIDTGSLIGLRDRALIGIKRREEVAALLNVDRTTLYRAFGVRVLTG